MTNSEFSNQFDLLVSSYRRFKDFDNQELLDSVEFDEFEKSLYLTQAQEEVVINLYNGKNPYGDSFESTEELRRYLDQLVKTKLYIQGEENIEEWKFGDAFPIAFEDVKPLINTIEKVSKNSIFFKLPEDIAFITFEQVTFADDTLGCYNGETADVYPVTQDEYNRIARNPYRGPTRYRVLRMDTGDSNVELISKYKIGRYLIKYLQKPTPIILVDLPNGLEIRRVSEETPCKLNDILHETILKRAVQMALTSKQANLKDKGEK